VPGLAGQQIQRLAPQQSHDDPPPYGARSGALVGPVSQPAGGRLSVKGAHDIITAVATAAGLEDDEITAHVLRHTFATRLVRGRTDLVIVAELLGHARLEAMQDKEARFTALLHHVDVDRLRAAYRALAPKAAPGVDGVTWTDYGRDLEANLQDLHARVHRGSYRARPSRRAYIPKADGRLRPLGIAALEDKVLQRAFVEVLGAIYETDFLGFSHGFRPQRSPHHALDALAFGITRKKVGWVLDADIRSFFTTLDHAWLKRFVEHRIADNRVLRLIAKWMSAGVIEDGAWTACEEGVPQGASASPLLANVYLHYVFDLWAHQWRCRHARGDVILVRFADDFVAGFERRDEAERFLADLRERFAKFNLELAADKTRLIEFGRFAARDRAKRRQRRPETVQFLGFTHICATTRNGRFKLQRVTDKKRMRAKLSAGQDRADAAPAPAHSPTKGAGWQA
jgi:RNA-directed DNA polymerase